MAKKKQPIVKPVAVLDNSIQEVNFDISAPIASVFKGGIDPVSDNAWYKEAKEAITNSLNQKIKDAITYENYHSSTSTKVTGDVILQDYNPYTTKIEEKYNNAIKNIDSILDIKDENTLDIKDEYIYRCLIYKNNCRYIRVTKGFECTDEELYKYAFELGHPMVSEISYLPSLNSKKTSIKKKARLYKKSKLQAISYKEFGEKTNHLFDKFISLDLFKHLINDNRGRDRVINSITTSNTCPKNVFISNAVDNSPGITTGNYSIEKGVEIISLDTTLSSPRFSNKTQFKISYIPYELVRSNNNIINRLLFFRFKVTSSKDSSDRFSGKNFKKEFEGNTYHSDIVKFHNLYDRDEKGDGYSVLEIVNSAGSSMQKFLFSDIEIYAINSSYLKKYTNKLDRKIEKNKKAIIVDDRRLTTFIKGSIVKVIDIKKNNSNIKNSVVTVVDTTNGNKETLLLKQLKSYGNSETKTNNKKESSISSRTKQKSLTPEEVFEVDKPLPF